MTSKLDDIIEAFGADSDIAEFYKFYLEHGVELKYICHPDSRNNPRIHRLVRDSECYDTDLTFNNKGELQDDQQEQTILTGSDNSIYISSDGVGVTDLEKLKAVFDEIGVAYHFLDIGGDASIVIRGEKYSHFNFGFEDGKYFGCVEEGT